MANQQRPLIPSVNVPKRVKITSTNHTASLTSDQTPHQLACEHYEKGRLHPRPTGLCTKCNGKIILCYGDIKKPHWKHAHDTNTSITHTPSGGESLAHLYAKRFLQNYLQDGHNCTFIHYSTNERIIIPHKNTPITFQLEYPYKNSIWDLVCITNDTIFLGIEIWNTHPTANIQDRNDIDWVEVKADDVIKLLDKDTLPSSITLKNYREQALKSTPSGTSILSILSSIPTLRQLAIQLNFYKEIPRYDLQTSQIMIARSNGCTHTSTYWYESKPDIPSREWKRIFNKIIEREQCICCDSKITDDDLYCAICYYKYVQDSIPQYDSTKLLNRNDKKSFIIYNKKIICYVTTNMTILFHIHAKEMVCVSYYI